MKPSLGDKSPEKNKVNDKTKIGGGTKEWKYRKEENWKHAIQYTFYLDFVTRRFQSALSI